MKCFINLVIISILFSLGTVCFAGQYDDYRSDFPEWNMGSLNGINGAAGSSVIDLLGENTWQMQANELWRSLANQFAYVVGDSIQPGLGQVIGRALPKVLDLVTHDSDGPTEAQIMTEIILQAIQASEGRIINALQSQYEQEINIKIEDLLGIYSLIYTETDLQEKYTPSVGTYLANSIQKATNIVNVYENHSHLSRIDNKIRLLHLYMLAQSLWIQLVVDDTQYNDLIAHINASRPYTRQELLDYLEDENNQREMKERLQARLRPQIKDLEEHIQSMHVDDWEKASNDLFSEYEFKNREYLGLDVAAYLLLGLRNGGYESCIVSCTYQSSADWDGSVEKRNYTYNVGDKAFQIEVHILNLSTNPESSACACINEEVWYFVRDVFGNLTIDGGVGSLSNPWRFDTLMENAIALHKKTIFEEFFLSGYAPVREQLDNWYELAYPSTKRKCNALDLKYNEFNGNNGGCVEDQDNPVVGCNEVNAAESSTIRKAPTQINMVEICLMLFFSIIVIVTFRRIRSWGK